MTESPQFNYIITIHNKEDLIKEVLTCVLICCRDNSHVYPVLDGCTDRTETIVDDLIKTFAHIPITKVYTPDVHEIRSINAGLKAANHQGKGYNIILQDDVLLHDFLLQERIAQLYDWAGEKLGFVSFRHGANLANDTLSSNSVQPFADYVENAYGHGIPDARVLLPGQLAYRTIAIKSPVCLPFELVRSLGLLEEKLAPYMCDDFEYSIRSTQAGYRNGVFGIRYQSDVDWGTTRTRPDSRLQVLEKRNIEWIKDWHQDAIAHIIAGVQTDQVIDVPGMVTRAEQDLAMETLKRNQKRLEQFFQPDQPDLVGRVKRKTKTTLQKLMISPSKQESAQQYQGEYK
jgi:glycosyltransferase involved in cell wall biosynthesis